ncbi:MAG: acyl-CoA dehydrogenase family protein [Chloroflexi bacterium]|nr:acyl-CoA dehydrogenase family protein [Chloroflexota bacterium]
MDFGFPAELEEFREEVRQFVRTDVPANWEGGGFEEEDPREAQAIRRKLAQRGWLTMAWPKEYGGMGAPHYQQLVFNEEMAYHRVPAADNSVNMLGPILMLEGTDEQKREFLPRIARAEMRWGQGYSEPEAGSDLASLQTRAMADGDDFVINGTKIWTSGAHHADWLFMLARTDPDAPKHRGISFFLADMKTPGLTIRPIVNMAGIHGFNQLFFDNVRVPKRNLVGEYNRGWYVGARLLDFERSGVGRSAGARRTLEELVQFARETAWNGQKLAAKPEVRNRLADMAVEVEVSRMISYRVGYLQSRGEVFNKEASVGKLFGSEMVQRLYGVGMSMMGLYGGLSRGSQWAPLKGRIQRGFLTSFSSTIAAGTSEIQRNVIAERGLGLPRG